MKTKELNVLIAEELAQVTGGIGDGKGSGGQIVIVNAQPSVPSKLYHLVRQYSKKLTSFLSFLEEDLKWIRSYMKSAVETGLPSSPSAAKALSPNLNGAVRTG